VTFSTKHANYYDRHVFQPSLETLPPTTLIDDAAMQQKRERVYRCKSITNTRRRPTADAVFSGRVYIGHHTLLGHPYNAKRPPPVSAHALVLLEARENSLSRYGRSFAPLFRATNGFPVYKQRFTNHLRALDDPIYPRLLEGPHALDAHIYSHYKSFQQGLLALLNMAMEDPPSAAIALTNFEQDPNLVTRICPDCEAWRVVISLLDHRGISMTVRLLMRLLQPQPVNERTDTYLHRNNLRASGSSTISSFHTTITLSMKAS
jgi:hypothetical protein